MKKYRLIKGKPREPRDEEILKNKDFKELIYNYQRVTQPIYKRPLYKDPKMFLGLVLVVIIAWLIFSANEQEEGQQGDPAPTEVSE